jgi:hypothetical protein
VRALRERRHTPHATPSARRQCGVVERRTRNARHEQCDGPGLLPPTARTRTVRSQDTATASAPSAPEVAATSASAPSSAAAGTDDAARYGAGRRVPALRAKGRRPRGHAYREQVSASKPHPSRTPRARPPTRRARAIAKRARVRARGGEEGRMIASRKIISKGTVGVIASRLFCPFYSACHH